MTVLWVLGLVVFAALVVAALVAATLDRARKEIDRRRCEIYEEVE